MNASTQLALMNSIGVLPFKRDNQWTVCCKEATTGNNTTKIFGNVSDVMMFAKGLVK
jgi:hypothetical protein